MAGSRKNKPRTGKYVPAFDPENRLQQLSALAVDKIEERILNGEATAAELVTIAKWGDPDRVLRRSKTSAEVALLETKKQSIEAEKKSSELYEEAINAMRHYQGHNDEML